MNGAWRSTCCTSRFWLGRPCREHTHRDVRLRFVETQTPAGESKNARRAGSLVPIVEESLQGTRLLAQWLERRLRLAGRNSDSSPFEIVEALLQGLMLSLRRASLLTHDAPPGRGPAQPDHSRPGTAAYVSETHERVRILLGDHHLRFTEQPPHRVPPLRETPIPDSCSWPTPPAYRPESMARRTMSRTDGTRCAATEA